MPTVRRSFKTNMNDKFYCVPFNFRKHIFVKRLEPSSIKNNITQHLYMAGVNLQANRARRRSSIVQDIANFLICSFLARRQPAVQRGLGRLGLLIRFLFTFCPDLNDLIHTLTIYVHNWASISFFTRFCHQSILVFF